MGARRFATACAPEGDAAALLIISRSLCAASRAADEGLTGAPCGAPRVMLWDGSARGDAVMLAQHTSSASSGALCDVVTGLVG